MFSSDKFEDRHGNDRQVSMWFIPEEDTTVAYGDNFVSAQDGGLEVATIEVDSQSVTFQDFEKLFDADIENVIEELAATAN